MAPTRRPRRSHASCPARGSRRSPPACAAGRSCTRHTCRRTGRCRRRSCATRLPRLRSTCCSSTSTARAWTPPSRTTAGCGCTTSSSRQTASARSPAPRPTCRATGRWCSAAPTSRWAAARSRSCAPRSPDRKPVRGGAYPPARRVPFPCPQGRGVGRRRRGSRRARRAPPPAPAQAGGRRRRLRGARRAVRRRAPHSRARRRDGHAEHVGLHRDVRDAERRRRGPAAARQGALPGARRPRDRPRRAARCTPAARAVATRRDDALRRRARLGALDVVHRAPRHDRLPPGLPPRPLPARGGVDVRGLQHRRPVLLGAAHRAAVVRRAQRRDQGRSRDAAVDGRARRDLLAGALGASLQFPGRQSACRHAFAAFRHIRDGRAAALRHRAGGGDGRLGVRGHPRLRPRAPWRALRRGPAGRAGADADRAAARAATRGPAGAGVARGRGLGGPGAGMSSGGPVTEDRPAPGTEPADDDEMPRVRLTRRSLIVAIVFIITALAFLYWGVPRLAGLQNTLHRIEGGDPWWLAIALAFTALSFGGYVLLILVVFTRTGSRIDWKRSYLITMAGLAATRIFAAGGAGGLALLAWALRRAGVPARQVATSTVAFLVLTYVVYMVALIVFGFGLYFGIFAGPAPFAVTVVPAIFGIIALTVGGLMALVPTDFERRLRSWAEGGGRVARLAQRLATVPASASAGIREALSHLRTWDPALLGAVAYWAFNIAVLWASFHAFGTSPPMAVLV